MSKKFIAFVKLDGHPIQQYDNVSNINWGTTTFSLTLENGKTVIVPKRCTIIEEK